MSGNLWLESTANSNRCECTVTDPTWQFDLTALFYESDFDSATFDDSAPSGSIGAFSLIDVDNQAGTAKVRANKDALTAGKYKVAVKTTGTWTGSKKDPNCSTCPNCGNCNNDTTTDVLFVVEECCQLTSITANKDPVAVGTPVTFTATGPENACLEKIKWSNGGNPSTETGPTFTTTFTETGEKTVQAKCPTGEPETKTVTVVGVEKIEIDPESLPDCCPGYYFTSNLIKFVAVPKPDVPDFPDPPTWEMIEKPEESNVSISGDGKSATLTPDQPGTYKVKAKEGTSEALITVQVLQKPQVGLWGDILATESDFENLYRDELTVLAGLPFGAPSLPCDLHVKYTVEWVTASNADFAATDLAMLFSKNLTIPANSRISDTRYFPPVTDLPGTDLNQPETFRIKLDLTTGCYTAADRKSYISAGSTGAILSSDLTYSIYDCLTPFVVGDDDDGISVMYSGIDGSDVSQGSIGDCYLMATLGLIAETCPQFIRDNLAEYAGGYRVQLYYTEPGSTTPAWHGVQVAKSDLNRGPNMANTSGDVNDDGCGEIWPMIFEQAILKVANESSFEGASTEVTHRMVTGESATEVITTAGLTSQEIYDIIADRFTSSSPNIMFETKGRQPFAFPDIDPNKPFDDATKDLFDNYGQPLISMNHCYYIQSISSSEIVLDNPWGERADRAHDVYIPAGYIDKFAARLVVLPVCN